MSDWDHQMTEAQILSQVSAERRRAHHLHGSNSQEGNDWDSSKSLSILIEEVGEVGKVFNERDLGNLTDLQAMRELRKELVQTAAMCLVWIVNVDSGAASVTVLEEVTS